ncbi:MAG TPA: NAD(P)/FAD-dependent oxidoreductase [Rhabdochlamydiaceae bacterium]|nr:NAD(P)/FAD-dependent oxidoreductase [Rhabdochlamydiaceae bacterium]
MKDLVVMGGGAAGIFAAIHAKMACPNAKVIVLEKTAVLLSKVRISGGGRCNVTHALFDPFLLVKNYPRGSKELIGPFQVFQPKDTVEWFESRGVPLKTEPDGRMFPISDDSETIIESLLSQARKLGVEILLRARIQNIIKTEDFFELFPKEGSKIQTRTLLLATGSSPEGYSAAESLGHSIQKPVPSLFTFNVPTSPLKELSGIAVQNVRLKIANFVQEGPLLITHFGFSGPAALKLSAWGARYLFEKNYHVELLINWLPALSQEAIFHLLIQFKRENPQKPFLSENLFGLPKNLWKTFLDSLANKRSHDISHAQLRNLAEKLHCDHYQVEGKTTNKEEFVTCGGVTLKEVNFKTMESKICPNLFFAGEILDIDGVTGGFNFQSAWTTGYIAGQNVLKEEL